MNRMVAIGILFVASGTALAYYANDRTDRRHAEVGAENEAPASGSEVLSSTQTQFDSSNRVRPIYAAVLSRIRNHLQAHVAESGDFRITVDLPALPDNLYEDPYSGTVMFGGVTIWTIEVFARRPARVESPPALTIRFDEPTEPQEGPRLIFSPDTLAGGVAIIASNGVMPAMGPLPALIPEADPDAAIAQLTESIIGAQLLKLRPVER